LHDHCRRPESRSIALILDASGSMNAKLAGGQTRLEAAKAAVAAFVEKLDPKTRLSYRAYGHQSPTKDKNCRDTELLVDFGAAGSNKQAILAKTQDVKAQGYTPITHVIQLAAADVGKEPGARAVVLVSDGKETCEGDPCAAAKAPKGRRWRSICAEARRRHLRMLTQPTTSHPQFAEKPRASIRHDTNVGI
jgi:Ca-activated chloride channel family protein